MSHDELMIALANLSVYMHLVAEIDSLHIDEYPVIRNTCLNVHVFHWLILHMLNFTLGHT